MPRRVPLGVPVRRGGNAERAGLGNRLAQQVDQRVADARVLNASGGEKKPHDACFLVSLAAVADSAGSGALLNTNAPASVSSSPSALTPAHACGVSSAGMGTTNSRQSASGYSLMTSLPVRHRAPVSGRTSLPLRSGHRLIDTRAPQCQSPRLRPRSEEHTSELQ